MNYNDHSLDEDGWNCICIFYCVYTLLGPTESKYHFKGFFSKSMLALRLNALCLDNN